MGELLLSTIFNQLKALTQDVRWKTSRWTGSKLVLQVVASSLNAESILLAEEVDVADMSHITYRSARLLRATFIQLHLQQKAGLFCDVFLQAEGEVISAHACVLSACSPFFTERLNGTRSIGQPRHLNLPGIKPTTLQKLVHYLYTSELEVTREELDGVLAAARQLHIPELEVLQLQGVKLVRTDSWPRLNRKCFKTCDQPSLGGAAKIKDSQDINQALMPDPAAEKGRDVAMVEDSSTRLSDTLLSVRCCKKTTKRSRLRRALYRQ